MYVLIRAELMCSDTFSTYWLTLLIWCFKGSEHEDLQFTEKYGEKYDVLFNHLGIDIILYINKNQQDATVCRYLFTPKLL